ncbi:MAG: hypothetical protein JWP87_6162 [Labilithrix sp.]|nr:hypothetical protein [Labilithrix sp.]
MTACSLDWDVRTDPGVTPVPETGTDVVDEPPIGVDAADAEAEATDAPISPEAAACKALEDDVALKKKKARECVLASGQCQATVNDQCDCPVVVKMAGSTQATAYAAAVAKLINDCGKPPCVPSCPTIGTMVNWFCAQTGPEALCSP